MIKNCKIICVVKGCATTGLLYNNKFYKVKKRWLARIGRMDLDKLSETEMYTQRFRICNIHFTERSYTSALKTGLTSEAEPELSLPDPAGPDSSGNLKIINMLVTRQEEGGECSSSVVASGGTDVTKTTESSVPVKEENVAIMTVSTVYSGSEDESVVRDDENTLDSNDLENMSLEKRLAKNSASCAVDPLLLDDDSEPSNSKTQFSELQTDNNEIPSYMRVTESNLRLAENLNEEELREELLRKEKLIKTLEKCIIEKSVIIQKLTSENLELKKKISK